MVRWTVLPALALALLAAGIACGGDDDGDGVTPSSTGASPTGERTATATGEYGALENPCLLITAEEVSAIMGLTFAATQQNSNPCVFAADVSAVAIEATDHGEEAEALLERVKQTLLAEEIEDPPGDRAVWVRGFREVDMLIGTYIVVVSVPDLAGDNERENAIAIAHAIVDDL